MTDTPPPAREPRPAASILVLRQPAGEAPCVLMARRGAGHRFMPNTVVFPGGAVDEADHHARFATPLAPRVQARLERSASPSLARALAMAAARELHEEVGLSLGEPPALDGLDYLCRAITPPERSMRFDARFFIVDASRVTGTAAGSVELEEPRWRCWASSSAGSPITTATARSPCCATGPGRTSECQSAQSLSGYDAISRRWLRQSRYIRRNPLGRAPRLRISAPIAKAAP